MASYDATTGHRENSAGVACTPAVRYARAVEAGKRWSALCVGLTLPVAKGGVLPGCQDMNTGVPTQGLYEVSPTSYPKVLGSFKW